MERIAALWKSKKWSIALLCFAALVLGCLVCLAMEPDEAPPVMDVPQISTGTATTPTIWDDSQDTSVRFPSSKPVLLEPTLHPDFVYAEANKPKKETFLELNSFTKKDFKKVNGYVSCLSAPYWLGVDVSVYQEDIDWETVANAGFSFAMVRLAYRGWRWDGPMFADTNGLKNIEGAQAAGLKVGVYFFSQATSVEEAIEEARFLLDLLDGRKLEMPVVFDWELPSDPTARTQKVKAKTMHAMAMAFCAEVEAAGYRPMLYFGQRQGKTKYNLAELREAGVELWLAMYSNAMTYTYKVQMWQYTENGRVPGIEGRVDIDIYFPEE